MKIKRINKNLLSKSLSYHYPSCNNNLNKSNTHNYSSSNRNSNHNSYHNYKPNNNQSLNQSHNNNQFNNHLNNNKKIIFLLKIIVKVKNDLYFYTFVYYYHAFI